VKAGDEVLVTALHADGMAYRWWRAIRQVASDETLSMPGLPEVTVRASDLFG
jgi:hypothetical protein